MNNDNSVVIESRTKLFLDSLAAKAGKDIDEMSIQEARIDALSGQIWNYEKLAADIKDMQIPSVGGKMIEIRIVRPKGSNAILPVVMYFHGGGWVLNNKDAHDRLIRELAIGSGAMVVFVEYSRSPEVTFPVAIEEAYAATSWIAENGNAIKADTGRIAVAGDSSGANMATVVALLAKKRGGPHIIYQVLFSPTLDANFDTASYRQFSEGYFLSRKHMQWFWDQYTPDKSARLKVTASPLRASIDELSGMPSALIITGEADVLRDEGEAYARKLMEAGVEVTAVRYLGTIHAFVFLNELSSTPAAIAAIDQANRHLQRAFSQTKNAANILH
jgi:acetyl esterase